MEEIGIVKEIIGSKAIVVVQRQSGCDSCPGGSICKLAGNEAEIETINEVRAKVGDCVRVVLKPYAYLKGTIFVYGVPTVMLVVGAIFGKEYLSKFLPAVDSDIVSALCGFGFFAIGLIFLKILAKRYEDKREYMPVISKIVKSVQ